MPVPELLRAESGRLMEPGLLTTESERPEFPGRPGPEPAQQLSSVVPEGPVRQVRAVRG